MHGTETFPLVFGTIAGDTHTCNEIRWNAEVEYFPLAHTHTQNTFAKDGRRLVSTA